VNFLVLQPLTSEQVAAAVALDQRCLGGLWSANGYQREIDSPNSDLLGLVALETTQPQMIGLACLWAILDEAHITLLAVDLPYRNQGLGQALLYALLRAAARRGLEWATLEVRLSNQTAIALYQKFGFERVGQRRGYYQDTGEDALILWRKGLQRPEFQDCLDQWQQQVNQRLAEAGWQIAELADLDALDLGLGEADSANFRFPLD
jgi:[ribosomal protein S18]-alanine N-acetyltransferase